MRSRKIAIGIYRDRHGLRVIACGKEKRFPFETPLETMRAWRQDTQTRMAALRPVRQARGTLAGDVTRYIETIKYLPSWRSTRSHLRAWTARYGAVLRSRLTSADVGKAIAAWVDRPVAPKTIRHRVQALRALYRALDRSALAPGVRMPTPADGVRLPELRRRRPVYVPAALIVKVEKQLKKHETKNWLRDSKTRARFRMIAAFGLRPSQVKRLERADVDLKRRTLTVSSAKGGEPVTFYLNGDMLAAARLFVRARAFGSFDTRSFARRLRKAGWPATIRPYNARHAVGIDLSEQGEDLDDIREWMGHTDAATTRAYYVPVLASRMKAMAQRLDGRLGWGQEPASASLPPAARRRKKKVTAAGRAAQRAGEPRRRVS